VYVNGVAPKFAVTLLFLPAAAKKVDPVRETSTPPSVPSTQILSFFSPASRTKLTVVVAPGTVEDEPPLL
jgi:hypothetical protein